VEPLPVAAVQVQQRRRVLLVQRGRLLRSAPWRWRDCRMQLREVQGPWAVRKQGLRVWLLQLHRWCMAALAVAARRQLILLVVDLPGRSGCRRLRAVWREADAVRTALKCHRVVCGRRSVLWALQALAGVPARRVAAAMVALVVRVAAAVAAGLVLLRVAVVQVAMV
jgi:hypothetical protein